MRMRTRQIPLLSDEAIFYGEQWIALAIGAVCFATAVWAGIHDYGFAGSAHRSKIGNAAFLLLNWSLTIASVLIGVVLLRFAFRGQSQENKTAERAHEKAHTGDHSASEISNVPKAATGSGGE